MPRSVAAIIAAAGRGTRMQLDRPKQFHQLGDLPVLVRTVRAFHHHRAIAMTVTVVPMAWLAAAREMLAEHDLVSDLSIVVAGGRRRQDSVAAGLNALDPTTEIVLVHDGARPLIDPAVIDRVIDGARRHGAAIAAIPVKDTLKRSDESGQITATVDRSRLWQAQTPQAAHYELLRAAFATAGEIDVTDEAMLLERAGIPVTLVPGAETNLKITRPEDLTLAEHLISSSATPRFRIGHGFDAHRLAPQRKLVLGGVEIPYELGLAGHSDADVLTHALCDALLGAIGAGDIGGHFPDSDPSYANIYSIRLLEQVMEEVAATGFRVGNLDITVICQKPRLAPYLAAIRERIAQSCRSESSAVNVKATTTEKMGYTGRGEGISCHAVALLCQ
ncbi:MAG: 2-C-methyl-D-erythritol 4-phosphate cytidylyltransferase [Desulfopila sp.]